MAVQVAVLVARDDAQAIRREIALAVGDDFHRVVELGELAAVDGHRLDPQITDALAALDDDVRRLERDRRLPEEVHRQDAAVRPDLEVVEAVQRRVPADDLPARLLPANHRAHGVLRLKTLVPDSWVRRMR